MDKLKYIIIFLLTGSSALVYGDASLCVEPMPGEITSVQEMTMTGKSSIHPGATLRIRVADKEMITSPKAGGKIEGLDINKSHLVKIIQGNKIRVSFWLKAKEYEKDGKADLCLRYYKVYGNFSVQSANNKPGKPCICH